MRAERRQDKGSMRQSLLAMLRGEAPRRVVWAADISYWMSGRQQEGKADPAWATEEGSLRFHHGLGVMHYYEYARMSAAAIRYDPTVAVTRRRDGRRTVTTIATPAGELTEEVVDLPESCCAACSKHFVCEPQDLDVLLYLLEHRTLVPANLDDYRARLAAWEPFDALPALGLPRSPMPSLCYEWAGVQNAVYLLADCPDKIQRALELMEQQESPILDGLCRLAPPLVHFCDNLDSENLTSLYDTHLAARHRRRLGRLHEAGVKVAVHLDGAVRGLLPKLAAAGFDAVEALTPKPAGDLDVTEMRAVAGSHRLILWGGVPGAMFAPPYTWPDMRQHVERTLDAWRGTPFVLGVADQVPPNGDITFCRKIADLVA